MALDKFGRLYIFELKATTSHESNILQVFGYAQLFGNSNYEFLDELYKKHKRSKKNLRTDFEAFFSINIEEDDFNSEQVFVVMTNGIDFKTREAIKYWRKTGLDIRPWVYRVYDINEAMHVEISSFSAEDNPFEDISEGYHIWNTNINNSLKAHNDMLENKKFSAYSDPWIYNVERVEPNDFIFLYQSGVGIIAFGKANKKMQKIQHDGEEEYYRNLNQFKRLTKPLSASTIKEITGINYFFGRTRFSVDKESGEKIINVIQRI